MSLDGTVNAQHVWKRFRPDRRRRKLADKFGQLNQVMRGQRRGWTWALRDIDFSLEPGESLGLVGTNGSGKSTLLKILSRVMYPYAGKVEVKGRVGALIEVAAGIHPELSGRENIFLYGTLLGLSRGDIVRRFDDIVAFSELERAIDRQVKYYSSGMKMRLGFAVAVYLEPDVLYVDEVLSVGDAAFQQRCLDRMREVLTNGTTLVYVSHDLATVAATCKRAIWIQQGVLHADGPAEAVINGYQQSVEESIASGEIDALVQLQKCEISTPSGTPPTSNGPLRVEFTLETMTAATATAFVGICDTPGHPIVLVRRDFRLTPGTAHLECLIDSLPLPHGRYSLWFGLRGYPEMETSSQRQREEELFPWRAVATVALSGPDLDPTPIGVVRAAPVLVKSHWDLA